jgi:hypothetical protein
MTAQQESVQIKKRVPLVAWAAAGVAVTGIWLAIAGAGAVAPDFVSGSQHEHLKVVGGVDWIWGLVATALVVLAVQDGIRRRVATATPWIALAGGVVLVWAGVLFITGTGPMFVTGTDPTSIPYAAMGAPILGVFLTWFVCMLVKSTFEQDA